MVERALLALPAAVQAHSRAVADRRLRTSPLPCCRYNYAVHGVAGPQGAAQKKIASSVPTRRLTNLKPSNR